MVSFPQPRRLPRGFSFQRDKVFRRNLSFVLHDHSESESVRTMAIDCQRHALSLTGSLPVATLSIDDRLISLNEYPDQNFEPLDFILSAQVGTPHLLEKALQPLGCFKPIVYCDQPDYLRTTTQFFNAPASLGIPTQLGSVVRVAAIVLRPGKKSTHLHVSGIFRLPKDTHLLHRELERVVHRYCDQWFTRMPLWTGPAEELLPDEVFQPI